MDVSFPALAHLVTVFGSTLNIVATSAGVSSGSASGVRADMYGLSSWTGTAILRFVAIPGSIGEPVVDVPYGLLTDHIAITSRDKSTTGSKVSVMTYPVCSTNRSHSA